MWAYIWHQNSSERLMLRIGVSKSGPLPGFINKVLLELSHTYLFTYCLWLLSCFTSTDGFLQHRLYDPQSRKYIYYVTLRKSLPPTAINSSFH